jgi:hypothetical protein
MPGAGSPDRYRGPTCSSHARLYKAPTVSLTLRSRITRNRQRCMLPPLGAQTPASFALTGDAPKSIAYSFLVLCLNPADQTMVILNVIGGRVLHTAAGHPSSHAKFYWSPCRTPAILSNDECSSGIKVLYRVLAKTLPSGIKGSRVHLAARFIRNHAFPNLDSFLHPSTRIRVMNVPTCVATLPLASLAASTHIRSRCPCSFVHGTIRTVIAAALIAVLGVF